MIDRAVRQARKDSDGDIAAIGDTGSSWSPRSKADAINDIDSGGINYYVPWNSGRTEIRVVNSTRYGRYLRTDRDDTEKNNLEDLPSC